MIVKGAFNATLINRFIDKFRQYADNINYLLDK